MGVAPDSPGMKSYLISDNYGVSWGLGWGGSPPVVKRVRTYRDEL